MFHQYPDWTASIRNHYWHLRYTRCYDEARRRKEYRRIEAEKNASQLEASILNCSGCFADIWLTCKISRPKSAGGKLTGDTWFER